MRGDGKNMRCDRGGKQNRQGGLSKKQNTQVKKCIKIQTPKSGRLGKAYNLNELEKYFLNALTKKPNAMYNKTNELKNQLTQTAAGLAISPAQRGV